MADSFYVTLPSNSSMVTHPNNTLTHFFVDLPTPLVFEGDWEVGLVKCSYPHSWFNITDTKNVFACTAGEEARESHEHHIPPGYYSTPVELLGNIKPAIGHNGLVSIKYNHYNRKIVIKPKPGIMVVLYDPLNKLFGFDDDESVITSVQKGSRVVEIDRFHSMFIYTNIIEHHIVGDTRAPY